MVWRIALSEANPLRVDEWSQYIYYDTSLFKLLHLFKQVLIYFKVIKVVFSYKEINYHIT